MAQKTGQAAVTGRGGAGVPRGRRSGSWPMRLLDWISGSGSGRSSPRPELGQTRLVEERDVRGFDTGMFLDHGRRQGTVNLSLPQFDPEQEAGSPLVDESSWREWEDQISRVEQMVCTATIDEAGAGAAAPRIATTFRAVGKAERRDMGRLATEVSLRIPQLYDHAEALGLSARPMTADAAGTAVARALTGVQIPFGRINEVGWDVFNEEVVLDVPAVRAISVAGPVDSDGDHDRGRDLRRCVAFVADISDDQVAGVVDQIMADWSNLGQAAGSGLLRRTRMFRPYVLPDGVGEGLATGQGRRWAVLTVVGNEAADVALRAAVDLAPEVGLKVRRCRGRMATGVLSGLGVGVCGWQHIAAADRITGPTAVRQTPVDNGRTKAWE